MHASSTLKCQNHPLDSLMSLNIDFTPLLRRKELREFEIRNLYESRSKDDLRRLLEAYAYSEYLPWTKRISTSTLPPYEPARNSDLPGRALLFLKLTNACLLTGIKLAAGA